MFVLFASAISLQLLLQSSRVSAHDQTPSRYSAESPDAAHQEATRRSTFFWADYDGDGLKDVFVILASGEGRLLRNHGTGSFDDVTERSHLPRLSGLRMVVWADFDHDGRPDLYVVFTSEPSHLFRNVGNQTFEDVTTIAGVDHDGPDVSAESLDYDGDGYLDLHVTSVTQEFLFHNLHRGQFERIRLDLPRLETNGSDADKLATRHGTPSIFDIRDSEAGRAPSSGKRKAAPSGTSDSEIANRETPASMTGISVRNDPDILPVTRESESERKALCVDAIMDQTSSNCIQASSTPMPGMLLPLGPFLTVTPHGEVGIGTTAPDHPFKLTVISDDEVNGVAIDGKAAVVGVRGDATGTVFANQQAIGVLGQTISRDGQGVKGVNTGSKNSGSLGTQSDGVYGVGHSGVGVRGESLSFTGVYGATSGPFVAGVYGEHKGTNQELENDGELGGTDFGVRGRGLLVSAVGVVGSHVPEGNLGELGTSSYGVHGKTSDAVAVCGESEQGSGVCGLTSGALTPGVTGRHVPTDNQGSLGGPGFGVEGIGSSSAAAVVGTHDPDGNIGRLGTVVNGVFGSSSTGDGVYGETSNVQASGIHGEAASSGATGVRGQNSAPGGTGVLGTVDAASGLGTGVIGEVGSPDGVGVFGSNTHYGTMGFVGAQSGVVGLNNSNQGVAVFGQCATVTAVYGETSGPPLQAAGVFGKNLQSGSFGALGVDVGAFGISQSNIGVLAQSSSGQPALEADNYGGGEAGSFLGDVSVQGNLDIVSGDAVINGNLNVSGSKNFRIDHPLDPANKYLVHSCIESPEMMNVYNGNVVTDASGDATVTLPDYFESLNRDFRYQLTVIGQFATAIVARKVNDNRFTVRTDYPHVEVSWQVTGIRQDAFARAHPVQVEQDKPMIERGRYLAPVEHGQPKSLGIGYDKQGERHPRCKLPVTVESVPCDRAKRLR